MNLRFSLFVVLLNVLAFSGCKSAYEQVRSSNDPQKILAAAENYYDNEEYVKAQGLYELVIPFFRGKKEAEDLFYKYTYTFYNQGQYILAAHYFNNFVKTFYNSTRKEEMAFMSALSNYKMSPVYKLDQTPSEKAIDQLQLFINNYPNSPRVDECNKLMDELRAKMETKSFEQGKLYYNLKNYQAAMTSLESTLKDFPETSRDEEIRYLIIRSSEELAKNSIYEKMEERLENTIELCKKYTQRYSKTDKREELKKIVEYCNNELKRFTND